MGWDGIGWDRTRTSRRGENETTNAEQDNGDRVIDGNGSRGEISTTQRINSREMSQMDDVEGGQEMRGRQKREQANKPKMKTHRSWGNEHGNNDETTTTTTTVTTTRRGAGATARNCIDRGRHVNVTAIVHNDGRLTYTWEEGVAYDEWRWRPRGGMEGGEL